MEKSKRNRRIYLCIIAAILLVVLYFLGSVYVWGIYVAEKELTKYASEVLDLNEKITCEYDWYNDRYTATNYASLDYRRDTHTIHDESFSQLESEKIRGDYAVFIQNTPDNLTFPKDVTVWTEISADNYNTKAQRLYLLDVWNTENLSETESLERPANIAMEVIEQLGSDYNFTGIQVIYYDKNGRFEIAFPADSFTPITIEKLLEYTEEDTDNLPESYMRWIHENGFN